MDVSIVVPDWTCSYCQYSRDLDFGRDLDLLLATGSHDWRCTECGYRIEPHRIEHAMINTVLKVVTAYQVQDIVCSRCHLVREKHMSRFCKCGGRFELSQPITVLMSWIQLVSEFAIQFKLKQLVFVVNWIQSSS